jgi:hypothetical protein
VRLASGKSATLAAPDLARAALANGAKRRETQLRSLAKAIGWRPLGSTMTTVLVWTFTHRPALSLTIGDWNWS